MVNKVRDFCISVIARVLILGCVELRRSILKYTGELGYPKSKYCI